MRRRGFALVYNKYFTPSLNVLLRKIGGKSESSKIAYFFAAGTCLIRGLKTREVATGNITNLAVPEERFLSLLSRRSFTSDTHNINSQWLVFFFFLF